MVFMVKETAGAVVGEQALGQVDQGTELSQGTAVSFQLGTVVAAAEKDAPAVGRHIPALVDDVSQAGVHCVGQAAVAVGWRALVQVKDVVDSGKVSKHWLKAPGVLLDGHECRHKAQGRLGGAFPEKGSVVLCQHVQRLEERAGIHGASLRGACEEKAGLGAGGDTSHKDRLMEARCS